MKDIIQHIDYMYIIKSLDFNMVRFDYCGAYKRMI